MVWQNASQEKEKVTRRSHYFYEREMLMIARTNPQDSNLIKQVTSVFQVFFIETNTTFLRNFL